MLARCYSARFFVFVGFFFFEEGFYIFIFCIVQSLWQWECMHKKSIQIRVQSKKKKKNLSQRTLNINGFHSYTLSMPPDSTHQIILMRLKLSDLEVFQNQGRK